MKQYLFSSALQLTVLVGGGLTGALASAVAFSSPAIAATLDSWTFNQASEQLTVTLPQGIVPRYLVLAEPARIVLEIPDTRLGQVQSSSNYDGQVIRIRTAQHDEDTVRIVLELAPGTRLDPRHAQLSSAPINGQVRWTLQPLLVDSTAVARSTPSSLPATDLPALPAEAGRTSSQIPPVTTFPGSSASSSAIANGEPRLSTSASNLMLPAIGDDFASLPEVLPIDPFSTSFADDQQVSVPDLDETIAISPTPSSSAATSTPTNTSAAASTSALPPQSPSVPPASVLETPPPTVAVSTDVAATPTAPTAPPTLEIPGERPTATPGADTNPSTDVSAPQAPPTTDEETTVSPPRPSAAPVIEPAEVAAAPIEPQTPPAATAYPSASPEQAITSPPPVISPSSSQAPSRASIEAPRTSTVDVINIPPPSEPSNPSSTPLRVPTVPQQSRPAPMAIQPPVVSAPNRTANSSQEDIIAFGQPLPNAAGKALDISPGDPNESVPMLTDVLLSAGTLLTLRYPGPQPITLEQNETGQATLVLAEDLRDGANRLVAPAGSRMVGHFQPTPTGQRWVSEALILSGGRVTLTTTSDYLAAAPEVSGGTLARNTGIGALAVAVISGFSGFGLIGGAIIGATTAVGTAPQTIVIQPDEIIEVRVLEDVSYAALDWNHPQPVGTAGNFNP